jgi:hypothetical protein
MTRLVVHPDLLDQLRRTLGQVDDDATPAGRYRGRVWPDPRARRSMTIVVAPPVSLAAAASSLAVRAHRS